MNDENQFGGQRRPELGEVGGIPLESGECRIGVGLAEEGHPTGEALIQHQTERVQVGATVEPLAAHLFG